MNLETVVSEVKERAQTVGTQVQEVAEVSFETLKLANDIVVTGVTELVKSNVETAKELFEGAKASFEKARADGLKAVVASPVEYLPEGREIIVAAFNETVEVVTKAGEDLVKTFKSGYGKISGETPAPVRKAKATARKAAGTVKKTARKVSAEAKGAAA